MGPQKCHGLDQAATFAQRLSKYFNGCLFGGYLIIVSTRYLNATRCLVA